MTPEELNRTIEFLVESQARRVAVQEQDREDRVKFEEWSRRLSARMAAHHERVVELLQVQSSRLDRAEKEDRAAQQRHEQLMQEMRIGFAEMRSGLNRIIDKMGSGIN
jgi:hypothetical protein